MTDKVTTHQVGPSKVSITGEHKIAELVRDELRQDIDGTPSPDISFHFQTRPYESGFDQEYECGSNFRFNDTDIQVQERGYSYHTNGLFTDGRTDVFVQVESSPSIERRLLEPVLALRSSEFNSYVERINGRFASYTTLWSLLHIELLQKGAAFVHAGIVDDEGEGTVIAGTGGAGKTSTTLEFLERDNFRYVSEDFGILHTNGTSFYSPRVMSLYYSDYTHHQSDIVDYIDNHLTGLDELHWRLHVWRGFNPKRKIQPEDVLGDDSIAPQTDIGQAVYISRTDGSAVEMEPVSVDDFVERSLWASFRELKRLYNLLCQSESSGGNDTNIPSLSELLDQTRAVYRDCFSDAETYRITVPSGGTPDEIVSKIIASQEER